MQTIPQSKVIDSAVLAKSAASGLLFKTRVFNEPELGGQSLKSLFTAVQLLRQAFPGASVEPHCLVQHETGPDFELYRVPLPRHERHRVIKLVEPMIVTNSLDFEPRIRENPNALLTLSRELDNALFAGLPPCRGSRTLNILASTASRQTPADGLMTWKEREIMGLVEQDFGYKLPRNKLRHDVIDRLVGKGFMRKFGSDHFLAMKGIAMYHFCIMKFTSLPFEDHANVTEACMVQRDRIIARYGCL